MYLFFNGIDVFVLLWQQIQHPTASLIAKVSTAQDDITGDGTTSNVLIIGELLKQADLYISEVSYRNSKTAAPTLFWDLTKVLQQFIRWCGLLSYIPIFAFWL